MDYETISRYSIQPSDTDRHRIPHSRIRLECMVDVISRVPTNGI